MSAGRVTPDEPERLAAAAQLRYVSDDRPGYRRRRCGRGFAYQAPGGGPVRDDALKAWLRSLPIPPAWREVWISPWRNGHLLATGRDARGRKQYLYHPRWQELRRAGNFHQLRAFGEALPSLRRRLDADLRRPGLPRERVLALVIYLLQSTLIRVGNPEYAQRNETYGLTTLTMEHLELSGSRLHFEFPAKGGQWQTVDLRDARAARAIRRCQELPGQELFQYLDADGQRRCIDSADVNAYLSDATGEEFTAKVFRTWGGSATAVRALLELGPPADEQEARRHLDQALEAAAVRLANTRAVCRRHYVHPVIEQAYCGRAFPVESAPVAAEVLLTEERVLLRLLREAASSSANAGLAGGGAAAG